MALRRYAHLSDLPDMGRDTETAKTGEVLMTESGEMTDDIKVVFTKLRHEKERI